MDKYNIFVFKNFPTIQEALYMRKARKDINQVKMVQSKERKIQDFNESKSYLRVISPTLSNRIKSCKISKKRQCRKNIFLRLNIFDFLRELGYLGPHPLINIAYWP